MSQAIIIKKDIGVVLRVKAETQEKEEQKMELFIVWSTDIMFMRRWKSIASSSGITSLRQKISQIS